MDIAVLRKRVVQVIEGAKRDAASRRARADEVRKVYEAFLEHRAVPIFRGIGNVLRSEGLLFDVITPAGGVRLVPERAREDGIELGLDGSVDPPRPMLTVVRTRGSRTVRSERPLAEGTAFTALSDEEFADVVLDELRPWLER